MKRLIAGLCAGAFALALLGCGSEPTTPPVKKPPVKEPVKEPVKDAPKAP